MTLVFRARPGILTNANGHSGAPLLVTHYMTTTRPRLSILKA